MKSGILTIVGTGIRAIGHITFETVSYIERADKVFYLIADPITMNWIKGLNPTAESLARYYEEGKHRQHSYDEMVTCILRPVRAGKSVCVAFYGHPGVFVFPSHKAISISRAEGHSASMLPAISAEDSLFADLGIDPATRGCCSFEATDFLIRKYKIDMRSPLILWQVGATGHFDYRHKYNQKGLLELVSFLTNMYPPDHIVIIYEAAQYLFCNPRIERVPLEQLPYIELSSMSTLFIPSLQANTADNFG